MEDDVLEVKTQCLDVVFHFGLYFLQELDDQIVEQRIQMRVQQQDVGPEQEDELLLPVLDVDAFELFGEEHGEVSHALPLHDQLLAAVPIVQQFVYLADAHVVEVEVLSL